MTQLTRPSPVRRPLKGIAAFVLVIALAVGVRLVAGGDPYAAAGTDLDLFGNIYKRILSSYVRDVDSHALVESGVGAMLEELDPYTVYMDTDALTELRIDTTGKVGGLGISITPALRDGVPTVLLVLANTPAERAGLVIGDRIVEVDGERTAHQPLEGILDWLRGRPGTSVEIRVERPGRVEWLEFSITRAEINVPSVTYTDRLEGEIGYLRLSHFTEGSADEFHDAIRETRKSKGPPLRGLILDLRGNAGGPLYQAFSVADKFLPRGQLIVETRGRENGESSRLVAEEDPIAGDIPLIVLVNGQSASASEVVAGAIQDADRGLIIGETTYGKGSVQTIFPLGDAAVKMTTAYYFTPSGRNIHKPHPRLGDRGPDEESSSPYHQRRTPGQRQPQEADEERPRYRTRSGRTVYGGGGITPDVILSNDVESHVLAALQRQRTFFSFAVAYVGDRPELPADFTPGEDILADFRAFVADTSRAIRIEVEGTQALAQLRAIAAAHPGSGALAAHVEALEDLLRKRIDAEFQTHADLILARLGQEFAGRLRGERARTEASFASDVQLQEALRILRDPDLYAQKMGLRADHKG